MSEIVGKMKEFVKSVFIHGVRCSECGKRSMYATGKIARKHGWFCLYVTGDLHGTDYFCPECKEFWEDFYKLLFEEQGCE